MKKKKKYIYIYRFFFFSIIRYKYILSLNSLYINNSIYFNILFKHIFYLFRSLDRRLRCDRDLLDLRTEQVNEH